MCTLGPSPAMGMQVAGFGAASESCPAAMGAQEGTWGTLAMDRVGIAVASGLAGAANFAAGRVALIWGCSCGGGL